MDDLISRQAAIDAMCLACGHDCDKSKFVYNAPHDEQVIMCPEHYALSTLPPAQPKELDALIKALEQEHKKLLEMQKAQPEIIRCKDCENWDTTWENDWAKDYHYCPIIDGTRIGDWYCADAKRRTDE